MKTSFVNLIILAWLICLTSGCALNNWATHAVSSLQDGVRFRQDLSQQRQEMRMAERDAARRELETLRRAELREIKRNSVQMVPQLTSVLSTTLNQKVTGMRLVPDYKAMAQSAAALAQLEEENDRIYQEQLAAWVRDQADAQRQQARFASWRRPFCRKHGYAGCNCPPEPDCGRPPPPRDEVRQPPEKPRLPSIPLQYKLEFSIESEAESSQFLEAIPGRAPLKDRCLPKPCDCDDGCDDCTQPGTNSDYFNYEGPGGSGEFVNPPKPEPDDETADRQSAPQGEELGGMFRFWQREGDPFAVYLPLDQLAIWK